VGKYGRFTGGTHFKRIKKHIDVKRVIEERATDEQLIILAELGLRFQKNAISYKRAQQLIDIKQKETKWKIQLNTRLQKWQNPLN